MSDMSEPLEITINLTEHYITHVEIREISITLMIIMYYGEVEGMNMDRGLGQGIQDYEFHSEGLKLQSVIHVDYSQKGICYFSYK